MVVEGNRNLVAKLLRASRFRQIEQIIDKALIHFGLRQINGRKYVSLLGYVGFDKDTYINLEGWPRILP